MKTIFEQTGWKRPYYQTICQDIKVLEKVTDFSFDLSNKKFIKYLRDRLGYDYSGANLPKETLLDILQNWSDERFITDPLLSHSVTGKLFSLDDRKGQLKVHCLEKAAIQDCWELFIQNNEEDNYK